MIFFFFSIDRQIQRVECRLNVHREMYFIAICNIFLYPEFKYRRNLRNRNEAICTPFNVYNFFGGKIRML